MLGNLQVPQLQVLAATMIGPVVYLTGVYAKWSKLLADEKDEGVLGANGAGWRMRSTLDRHVHGDFTA